MKKNFKEWYLERNPYIPEIDTKTQHEEDICNDIMRETIELILNAIEEYEEYKNEN